MIVESNDEVLENLQNTDRRVRLRALKHLQTFVESTKDLQQIVTTFDECYLHLLNCYNDKYESCREQSTLTVGSFMRSLPVNDFYLQNIIASMVSRMGKAEIIEESEEIRLLHINLLLELIEKYKKVKDTDYLSQSYDDIINILYKALADPFPAVQKQACTCVVKLSTATSIFQLRAEHLAKPLFAILNHKHSQSRIAAVEACYHLALHIDPKSETLLKIFYETSPLLMDSMPLVRRECGRMGCLMLMELRDRYSFFDRIIPLILCCLKDDSPEVRDFIAVRWKECGKLYYDENETELKKLEIGEKISENYPSWEVRPTIGCRALVQRSLRLLHPIMRESTDWKDNVRLHSLRLLYQFVLHAEAAMTAKFFEIYPDLAKACADPETLVAKEAMKAADLMGRLLCYADWRNHAIDGLEKNPRLGYVRCFYHLIAATTESNADDVLRLSEILVEKEFSQSLKFEFQLYVLRLVDELWRKNTTRSVIHAMDGLTINDSDLERNLYAVTIRVMALSFVVNIDENHVSRGQEILEKVAQNTNSSIAQLHTKHLNWVLEAMSDLDAHLDSLTEPILLLSGVIQICGFRSTSISTLKQNIRTVWANAADDAKIKVFSAMSIAMLKWNETIGLQANESKEELEKIITELIEENLAWKVGSAAESMRSLATATLCSMAQGAPEQSIEVLPPLIKYFTNLLEDNALTTRSYALKCLLNFGEVEVESLIPIAFGALQRLDDPHSGTRELAAMVIPKLRPICSSKHDQDTWNAFIRRAASTLFLYFDGPEVKLKEVIKDSLIQLGKQYPTVIEEPLHAALATSYQKKEVEDIQQAISQS